MKRIFSFEVDGRGQRGLFHLLILFIIYYFFVYCYLFIYSIYFLSLLHSRVSGTCVRPSLTTVFQTKNRRPASESHAVQRVLGPHACVRPSRGTCMRLVPSRRGWLCRLRGGVSPSSAGPRGRTCAATQRCGRASCFVRAMGPDVTEGDSDVPSAPYQRNGRQRPAEEACVGITQGASAWCLTEAGEPPGPHGTRVAGPALSCDTCGCRLLTSRRPVCPLSRAGQVGAHPNAMMSGCSPHGRGQGACGACAWGAGVSRVP